MRDAIALALDGTLPPDIYETIAAYRAAMVPLSSVMVRQLRRLRTLSAAGLVAACARFDDTHRLLDALGVDASPTAAIPECDSWPGVIFVGCLGDGEVAHDRWIKRMLGRGAIIVSSDRSAALPVIADGLIVETLNSGRRVRLAIRPDLADLLSSDADWGRLVADMHPAVRLAPGYLPLAFEQHTDTRIIARDALSNEPLVALAHVAGGQVLHSVAHWWQDVQPDTTELGRRTLASVPAFSALGLVHREARLGGFASGSAMLACLLAGVDAALDRAGGLVPPTFATAITEHS